MTTVCLGLGVDEAIWDFSWCFSSLFDKFCKICRTCERLSSSISTRNINEGFPLFSWTLNVQGFHVCFRGLFLEWTSSHGSLLELLSGSSLLLQVGLSAHLLWRSL